VRSAYLYIQSPCNVLCSTTESLQCLEFHYKILTCPTFHYEILGMSIAPLWIPYMSYFPIHSPCNVHWIAIDSLCCLTFEYTILVMFIYCYYKFLVLSYIPQFRALALSFVPLHRVLEMFYFPLCVDYICIHYCMCELTYVTLP